MSIGPPAGIAVGQHDIIKIERMLAERGDVHNAGLPVEHHNREQQPREQEPGKIIDGEAQLITVLTGLSFPSGAA